MSTMTNAECFDQFKIKGVVVYGIPRRQIMMLDFSEFLVRSHYEVHYEIIGADGMHSILYLDVNVH
jgi:hypothetical protein